MNLSLLTRRSAVILSLAIAFVVSTSAAQAGWGQRWSNRTYHNWNGNCCCYSGYWPSYTNVYVPGGYTTPPASPGSYTTAYGSSEGMTAQGNGAAIPSVPYVAPAASQYVLPSEADLPERWSEFW